ncbi:phosphatase PAP2 family protein [Streptomyces sp. NPDC057718]|uniref:phosphatase PAP2 family protein n=1 Tax=Streptomyces sp. NPDC057718 TaxID=3346225 RepID=UPI0036A92A32
MSTPTTPRSSSTDMPRRRVLIRWCLLSAAAFAGLTAAVLAVDGGLLAADADIQQWVLQNRPAPLVTVLDAMTATGTRLVPYLAAVAAGLIAAPAFGAARASRTALRLVVPAVAFAVWLALGQALRFTLMSQIARPRPPAEDWLTHASRWSFPSGHATTSAMAAGLLVLALLLRRPSAYREWVALAVVWAAVVGVSRVWLGVHWFSDVLAGWLLAAAWTLFGAVIAVSVASPRSASSGVNSGAPQRK